MTTYAVVTEYRGERTVRFTSLNKLTAQGEAFRYVQGERTGEPCTLAYVTIEESGIVIGRIEAATMRDGSPGCSYTEPHGVTLSPVPRMVW